MCSVLVASLVAMGAGFVLVGWLRLAFSRAFARIKEAAPAEVPGPHDNFSAVRSIAGAVKIVYSPVGAARYVPREGTVFLSYPEGSRVLWALLEAAHEAGHVVRPHRLAEAMVSSWGRKPVFLIFPIVLSFLTGRYVGSTLHSFSGFFVYGLLVLPQLLLLAAIAHDELRVAEFSFSWLAWYLRERGFAGHVDAVRRMVRAEKAFLVLDSLGLFLIFAGATVSAGMVEGCRDVFETFTW